MSTLFGWASASQSFHSVFPKEPALQGGVMHQLIGGMQCEGAVVELCKGKWGEESWEVASRPAWASQGGFLEAMWLITGG